MKRPVAVRALRPFPVRPLGRRFQSTAPPSEPASASKLQGRIDRVIARCNFPFRSPLYLGLR